jgi:prephenate dehydratase
MKVACLGPKGSFSSLLTHKIFPNVEIIYMQTYQGCQSLKNRDITYAVYPLENNTGGFVSDTLRSIYQTSKISIVRLETIEIEQNLIGHAKEIGNIREIHSHPQAIAQCKKRIENLERRVGRKIKIVKQESTSEGVLEASKNPKVAAIGSKEAAYLYNVPIIRNKFQDKSRNETRFAILQIGRPKQEIQEYNKTMFLLEVKNMTGGLAQILNLIGSLSINISSLTPHSIYRENGSWEYAFFLEVEGHISNGSLKILHKILSGKRLSHQSRKARWIGSYLHKKEKI